MSKRLTTEIFIERARAKHGNKYNYSKVEYRDAKSKVSIICPVHGEFMQSPDHHMSGNGCPKCSGCMKLTTFDFIERARQVHGNKYDYSKVDYVNNQTKVEIICPVHGSFWQRPADHMSGQGCKVCGDKLRGLNRLKTLGEFITDAQRVHGNKYNYDKVEYVADAIKVCIICPEHGEFWQTPSSHLQGHGCPECAKIRVSFLMQKSCDDFIKDAQLVHGDKYDYSKVNYTGSLEPVCIICPEHGEFWQMPSNHLRGKGCPICGLYHDKEAYVKACLTKRSNGTFNSSGLQNSLRNLLTSYFGKKDVVFEYNENTRYPFACDFYIKSLDLFIELNGHWTHGSHWFDKNNPEDISFLNAWIEKSESSQFYKNAIIVWTKRDVEKREYARENNLNYVVLWNKQDIDEWMAEGCPIRQDWK